MTAPHTDKPEASQRPPAQWQAQSAGLSMRLDATDAGRLVRLADVALWLIESEGLPRAPAVERLADQLEAAQTAPALFLAQPGNYAQQIEGDAAMFGYQNIESWAVSELREEMRANMRRNPERYNLPRPKPGYELRIPAPTAAMVDQIWADVRAGARPAVTLSDEMARTMCEPGRPALLRLLRERWKFARDRVVIDKRWHLRADAEIFNDPRLPGFAVAVCVADAARIWGWGAAVDQAPAPVELNTYADVVKHHRANRGALWDVPPGQYDLLRAEEKRANDAGEMGVRARMAQDFGVSVRRIGQLLAKIESGSRATQRTRAQKVQPLPSLKAV